MFTEHLKINVMNTLFMMLYLLIYLHCVKKENEFELQNISIIFLIGIGKTRTNGQNSNFW